MTTYRHHAQLASFAYVKNIYIYIYIYFRRERACLGQSGPLLRSRLSDPFRRLGESQCVSSARWIKSGAGSAEGLKWLEGADGVGKREFEVKVVGGARCVHICRRWR